MPKKIQDAFDTLLYWDSVVKARDRFIPKVDLNSEFLSSRDASDFLNSYFSRTQIDSMRKHGYLRSNEKKRIYKKDLEFIKPIIDSIEYLRNEKIIIKKTDIQLDKSKWIAWDIKQHDIAQSIEGTNSLIKVFEWLSLPHVKAVYEHYNNNIKK